MGLKNEGSIEKLNKVLRDFSNAFGINIITVDRNFSSSKIDWALTNEYCRSIQCTEKGALACNCSDRLLFERCKKSKRAETHKCHAGLTDVAVPIVWDNEILGYMILGQMRTEDQLTFSESISEIPIPFETLKKLYSELPLFDEKKAESIANIATMVSKYILLENIWRPETNDVTIRAADYIESNLDRDLTIEAITSAINICRNALYKNFEQKYSCTPGEYIKLRRIEKSKELLLNSSLSIEEISQRVGFSNGGYYSRIFKELNGISPLNFRKKNS